MNILQLPLEMVCNILEYLPQKNLNQAKLVCKIFNAVGKIIPVQPNIPLIARDVLEQNAILLWEHPTGDFFVENKASLKVLSPIEIGKTSDERLSLDQQSKINKAIEMTLKEIYRINYNARHGRNNYFFVNARYDGVSITDSLNLEAQRGFSSKSLAEKILESGKFDHINIRIQASLLKTQSLLHHVIRSGRSRSLPT